MLPHPFADRWNHNTHYYPLICQHIPDEASTILDIGTGEGRLPRYLARPGRTVIGIDPDRSALPESVPGIDFRVGSAERLPVEDASIDAATMVMVLLDSDGPTKGIVRIGDTVRRPSRPFTATVQQYLAHLHDQEFTAAPIPMGFDERGREILSYVAGEVPHEPLPDWATSIRVLEDMARLVRRLHDAAEGWEPPADAVWGSIPGDLPPGFVPLFDEPELVAHADYCPGNVVFRDGLPYALIDFDLARPTTRMADAVNALYWWVPLLHPVDRPPALVDADISARVIAFANAYGMTREQRAQIVPLAVRRTHNTHLTMRAAAQVDPVFKRFWDEGVKDRMPRAEQWWAENADEIAAALNTVSEPV